MKLILTLLGVVLLIVAAVYFVMPADQLPVVSGAKGDFVWLIFEHEDKDPRNPANTYHYNSFDVLRIENGKVQEHWDSAQKMAGSGTVKIRRLRFS